MTTISPIQIVFATIALVISSGTVSAAVGDNDPGILEPCLTVTTGQTVRIPHTDQAQGDTLLNVVGPINEYDARGAMSITGHPITQVSSPNDDFKAMLVDLDSAAGNGDQAGDERGRR